MMTSESERQINNCSLAVIDSVSYTENVFKVNLHILTIEYNMIDCKVDWTYMIQ